MHAVGRPSAGYSLRPAPGPTTVQECVGCAPILVPVLLALASACSRTPSYELNGQIVAVDPARQEIDHQAWRHQGLHAGDDDGVQGEGRRVMSGKTVGRPGPGDARRRGHARLPDACRRHRTRAADRAAAGARAGRRAGAGRCRAGRARCRPGRGRAPPVRLARPGRGRHVHIHPLSAAGLLPVDGSAFRGGAARAPKPSPELRDRLHLLSVTLDPVVRHAAGAAARTRARLGAQPERLDFRRPASRPSSIASARGSASR